MRVEQTSEDSWTVYSDSGKTYHVVDAGPEDMEYGGGVHCDSLAGRVTRTINGCW